MLTRKKPEIEVKYEPPKFERAHICVDQQKVTISLNSVELVEEYANRGHSAYTVGPNGWKDVPRTRFSGSLTEAREYAAALSKAIEDATRLEGAVSAIYA